MVVVNDYGFSYNIRYFKAVGGKGKICTAAVVIFLLLHRFYAIIHIEVGDFMKRIFILITIIIVVFSLSACDLNPIVNKLNGNEASAKAQQEKEKYTELADGTYLYKQSNVSTENNIQFMDEENNVLLDSSDIMFVSAKWSEYNSYYIQFEFNEQGTIAFANATKENKGKKMHIVLDEQILSSPMVVDEITNGVVIISNYKSYDELISFFNKVAD